VIEFPTACSYLKQLDKRREKVNNPDVTLVELRQALYAFMGIKDEDVESQLAKMPIPVNSVTKEMMDAWHKAGMPSPPQKFFKEYGRPRKNISTDNGSD